MTASGCFHPKTNVNPKSAECDKKTRRRIDLVTPIKNDEEQIHKVAVRKQAIAAREGPAYRP